MPSLQVPEFKRGQTVTVPEFGDMTVNDIKYGPVPDPQSPGVTVSVATHLCGTDTHGQPVTVAVADIIGTIG